MINVLVPMAGKSKFFQESGSSFPKPLVEINGVPMIQLTIEGLQTVGHDSRFVFVVNQEDVLKYHLDQTLRLLTDASSVIVQQKGSSKGAVCSCLLAIEAIDNQDELVISNSDQRLSSELQFFIDGFRSQNADAGVIIFDSVHPQWSYVRLETNNLVCEAAEKRPISKNAVAGLYYFRHGADFVSAAKATILKDAKVNDLFFVAPTLNELILEGKRVVALRVDNGKYHSFYSWEKIKDYEARFKSNE